MHALISSHKQYKKLAYESIFSPISILQNQACFARNYANWQNNFGDFSNRFWFYSLADDVFV